MAVEIGRLCIKKSGRDSGRKCVVTNVISDSIVEILSSGRKKARKCNMKHLEFLDEKIVVGGSEEEIRKGIEVG